MDESTEESDYGDLPEWSECPYCHKQLSIDEIIHIAEEKQKDPRYTLLRSDATFGENDMKKLKQ